MGIFVAINNTEIPSLVVLFESPFSLIVPSCKHHIESYSVRYTLFFSHVHIYNGVDLCNIKSKRLSRRKSLKSSDNFFLPNNGFCNTKLYEIATLPWILVCPHKYPPSSHRPLVIYRHVRIPRFKYSAFPHIMMVLKKFFYVRKIPWLN